VLVGGGGSGKSVFAAQKCVKRVTGNIKHRILVVRKVATTLRESVFALIKATISEWNLMDHYIINKSDMTIKNKLNGNEFIFVGVDDVEKLKSIYNITDIWIEEASELTIEDFRQLDVRLRGKTESYKQIILSFNPIYQGHWLQEEFINSDWTAKKKNSTVHHTTYKDNRFLDDEQKDVLEGFKETDPYYYTVYCLGEWGVLGQTVFPAQIVSERIAYLRDRKPERVGFFIYDYVDEKIPDTSIRWVDDPNGYIKIYKKPEVYYPYVVGGDTAGDGSDNFTGHVLDNTSGEQVAVLCHRFDEDLYVRQMYCLGKYYNYALMGIEINFSTYPVKELQRLGYTRQFRREAIDEISKKKYDKFGFQTTKLSRPLIIANLVQKVREHIKLFNDVQTLQEMLTFVRNEKGKAEAQEGQHDDNIMGLAIAHYVVDQQSREAKLPEVELEGYYHVGELRLKGMNDRQIRRLNNVHIIGERSRRKAERRKRVKY
jgi:phage terminase large subunit